MRKHTLAVGTLFIANLTVQVAVSAQSCNDMLRNGVYDSFNVQSYNRSSSEWHHAWCSGTIQSSSGSNSGGGSIGVVIDGIPLGMSASDADTFQKFYKQHFCSVGGGENDDLSKYTEIRSTVNPTIVNAYVACHAVEAAGLQTQVVENGTKSVFTVAMRYSPPFATKGPVIKSVSFAPAVVTCTGSLADAMHKRTQLNANWQAMQCTRLVPSADVSLLVDTDAGAFTHEISPELPPPTSTQLVLAALPRGTILGWYDSKNIPAGWQRCDGTNGTPNLVDRYVMGTDGTKLGSMIGTESHSHTVTVRQAGTTRGGFDDAGAFQVMGTMRQNHLHTFSTTVSTEPNTPLGTQVMFIMKL